MRITQFGRSGLRVSELCLGAMTFGDEWDWGADADESRRIFDAYVDAGGNFVDTANVYTDGSSEKLLGTFVRSQREQMVIASKYSLTTRPEDPNGGGNHRKNLIQSVERSLQAMQLDYLDILWLHAWDYLTPEEETLRGLDDLVSAGKILYTGVSDTPAWVVARSNAIAELRGWTAFCGLQLPYSLMERSAEREFFPMARSLDLSILAWGCLAGGRLTGKYSGDKPAELSGRMELQFGIESSKVTQQSGDAIVSVLKRIADDVGGTPAQIALAWVRRHYPTPVIPLIGARTLKQLKANLDCLNVELSSDQIEALDEVSAIELGFPHDFLATPAMRASVYGTTYDRLQPRRWHGK